jgi:hypothetical protein
MNDVLFIGIIIFLGVVLGTFLKYSMFGINSKLSLLLTLVTPLLLLSFTVEKIMKNLNNPKKILKYVAFPVLNYPTIVTVISEITLEVIAMTITRKNAQYKREFREKNHKKPKKPPVTEKNLGIETSFEIIKKTFNRLNQASVWNYKVS